MAGIGTNHKTQITMTTSEKVTAIIKGLSSAVTTISNNSCIAYETKNITITVMLKWWVIIKFEKKVIFDTRLATNEEIQNIVNAIHIALKNQNEYNINSSCNYYLCLVCRQIQNVTNILINV